MCTEDEILLLGRLATDVHHVLETRVVRLAFWYKGKAAILELTNLVARLREILKDYVSDEDDVDIPVDEDGIHFDVVNKVEGLLISYKLWIHS